MDVERNSVQDKLDPVENEAPVASEIYTLSERCASRGVVKVVKDGVSRQIENEEETRKIAPDAYRLSQMTDAEREELCGKENGAMTASDLLRYFDETRSLRREEQERSLDQEAQIESDVEDQGSKTALCHRDSQTVDPVKGEKRALRMVDSLKKHCALWVDSGTVDSKANRKTFPLSAFAAIAAVAVSLMLIVASSVMVAQAEGRVNTLNRKIDKVALEVSDLEADWNVQNDLVEIRKIAVEEYGMIGEEYVKTRYINLTGGGNVEVFEEEERDGIRLSALLNAIGIGNWSGEEPGADKTEDPVITEETDP